jgi:hypothetical protein
MHDAMSMIYEAMLMHSIRGVRRRPHHSKRPTIFQQNRLPNVRGAKRDKYSSSHCSKLLHILATDEAEYFSCL